MIGRKTRTKRPAIAARRRREVVRWTHPDHKYEIVHVLQIHDEDDGPLPGRSTLLATAFQTFCLHPHTFTRRHDAVNAAISGRNGGRTTSVEDVLEMWSADGTDYQDFQFPPHLLVDAYAGGYAGVRLTLRRKQRISHEGAVTFVPAASGATRRCACCRNKYVLL
ncbi:MAG: hypothetical protein ACREX3_14695 [Gammaproteobacteria bacterium]